MVDEFVETMIMECIQKKISDVYFFPKVNGYCVKMRKNQKILSETDLTTEKAVKLISYFKYHAGMEISECRRPQLGSYAMVIENQKIQMRFSSVGDYLQRESLVIRFLYPMNEKVFLKTFFEKQLLELREATEAQRGLLLFCGPTGSGKTTSMYWLAGQLQQKGLEVMTIEDPVEIDETNFLQLEVNEKAGITYAELIKVGLRHRPDVFLIGEIRDFETAQNALTAALSGHLVFATVHAKSGAGILPRLREMGIDNADLQQCLVGIAYQRLIEDKMGDVKSLFDLYFESDLNRLFTHQEDNQVSSRWREYLKQLRTRQVIDEKSYHNFEKG